METKKRAFPIAHTETLDEFRYGWNHEYFVGSESLQDFRVVTGVRLWRFLRRQLAPMARSRCHGRFTNGESAAAVEWKVAIGGQGTSTLIIPPRGNQLYERFDASPALAGNQLFLRGSEHLYCIEDN